MDSDPEEDMSLENEQVIIGEEHGDNQDGDDEIIDSVEGSNEWTVWRDNLAHEIHVWTDEETEVFVGFMEELVIEGRIADAGQFRPGSFEKLVAKMNESLLDEEDTDIFNSNHDCSESLLQQLNSVASSSGKKQGKKPSSFNAAKDTKMMKGLTDTLKYVFDQQETRLDAFAQAMI
ncbi:uncharacterized protein DS421_13g410390 [Arachis hypogaea]|nr:uncharacterized protein DS421_13g410390 [Arachis hypogaea]